MKQQLTKAAIEEAFIALVSEKPFEKVTVKDIVDYCGLTRNTFYYYYEDTYDVVDEILTRRIEEQLALGESAATPEEVLLACVRFATQNQRLAIHLFNSPKREELEIYFKKAEQIIMRRYVDVMCGKKAVADSDRTIICDYCRHCVHGMLEEWISSGMKYDLEQRIRRMAEIFGDGIRIAVERAAQ